MWDLIFSGHDQADRKLLGGINLLYKSDTLFLGRFISHLSLVFYSNTLMYPYFEILFSFLLFLLSNYSATNQSVNEFIFENFFNLCF